MAEITDLFGKASIDSDYAVATTVVTDRTSGVTVLEAFDLSKFTEDTPVFFLTYKKTVDPITSEVSITDQVSWKGLVNSGANTITNLTVAPGYVDIGNDVGDFVECIPTSYWGNSLIDGLLATLNPDGTLKDDVVVTDAIDDAAVTPDKLDTGAAEAYVATSQTRNTLSYGQLTTTTDQVTVDVGANGLALVNISARIQGSNQNAEYHVGIDVSGASTVAAADSRSLMLEPYADNAFCRYAGSFLFTGLTPGSTTFKMMYKPSFGTITAADRRIGVVPL